MTRLALDTNVLGYAEGVEKIVADRPKIRTAQDLLQKLIAMPGAPVVAVQALAELHHLLVRKGGYSPLEAATRIERVRKIVTIVPTAERVFSAALALAGQHKLRIFDAIIVAAAAEAQCDLLLSEDMHDGFTWRGVTIVNPFGPAPDPRLGGLLN